MNTWDFHTTILKHPITSDYLDVYVNSLGGSEWEVLILDFEDGSVVYQDVTTAYNSNHLRIADSAVMFLEFV